MTGDFAAGSFAGPYGWNDGGIGLQLAVDFQGRLHLAGQSGSLDYLVDHRVAGAPFGREAQHGDAGGYAGNVAGGLGGRYGNLGQFFGCGVGHDGTVGKYHQTLFTVRGVGDKHQEGARHDLHAGNRLDNLEGRPQYVTGCVAGTGNLAVGIAVLNHEAAQVQGVFDRLLCFFQSHAFGFSQLVEQLGIGLFLFVAQGVHQGSLVDVGQLILIGKGPYFVGITNEDYIGYVVGQNPVGSL